MSLSQFTSARLVPGAAAGSVALQATGPLEGVDLTRYVPPFVIHVTIIQTDEDDHDPANAKRASGYTSMDGDGEWEATLLPVNEEDEFDPQKPARGVGVAVLARTEGYTYETLTWCDHLPDLSGTVKPRVAMAAGS